MRACASHGKLGVGGVTQPRRRRNAAATENCHDRHWPLVHIYPCTIAKKGFQNIQPSSTFIGDTGVGKLCRRLSCHTTTPTAHPAAHRAHSPTAHTAAGHDSTR